MQIGIWSFKGEELEPHFEPDSADLGVLPDAIYKNFIENRKKFFEKLLIQRPPNTINFENIIETSDLLKLKEETYAYISAYLAVIEYLSEIKDSGTLLRLMNLDSLLKEGEIILSPLHPLKLIWFLQYQELLSSILNSFFVSEKVDATFDKDILELISSLNFPPFTSRTDATMLVNTGRLHLLWSVFSENPEKYRRTIDRLSEKLGTDHLKWEFEAVNSQRIHRRVERYLRLHPFVKQLKVNVVNPGDGSAILDVIRFIQKEHDLKYELKFFVNEHEEKGCGSF